MKESSFEGVGGLKIATRSKLYEGHYHDLLNDIDKEVVMADIQAWIDARLPRPTAKSALASA